MTTNPFFVPTKYGAEDACKLLGCSYQWTGSETSNVNEMVNAFNSAISAKADGIAVALVDQKAFNGPIDEGARRRASRCSATTPTRPATARLAYIGQDLFVSGQEMGKHIVDLVGSGDVALFIATPGSLNIQPRIDGAIDTIKKSGEGVTDAHDRHRRRAAGASCRRSTPTGRATRTPRACSPSTPAARRASRR